MSEKPPLILCVDDDPDVLNYLQIVLEAEGYRFAAASTGEEALHVYKEVAPDLLIVDLMMEEVDAGTGLVKNLRLLGNTAPVFMLSSVGDNLSMTLDYTSLGLQGVLQKPLEKEVLLNLPREALSAPSSAS